MTLLHLYAVGTITIIEISLYIEFISHLFIIQEMVVEHLNESDSTRPCYKVLCSFGADTVGEKAGYMFNMLNIKFISALKNIHTVWFK